MICPVGICTIELTANADEPPPAGSTASTKCRVLYRERDPMMSMGILARGRVRKRSTSVEGKALLLPSALMPMLSRRSMAGSSLRSALTVSILADDNQRGISASLCVHFSGWSVLRHSSHTSVMEMLSNSLRPTESVRSNIFE